MLDNSNKTFETISKISVIFSNQKCLEQLINGFQEDYNFTKNKEYEVCPFT